MSDGGQEHPEGGGDGDDPFPPEDGSSTSLPPTDGPEDPFAAAGGAPGAAGGSGGDGIPPSPPPAGEGFDDGSHEPGADVPLTEEAGPVPWYRRPWVYVAAAAAVVLIVAALLAGFLAAEDKFEENVVASTIPGTPSTLPVLPTTTEPPPTTTEAPPTTTEPPPTTTEPPPTTTEPDGFVEVDDTPITVELADVDGFEPALPDDMDVEAGWYVDESGDWVVVYRGWDVEETGPRCPGTAVEVEGQDGGTAIQNELNSPTEPGACSGGFDNVVQPPPAGAYVCDTLVYFVTGYQAVDQDSLIARVDQAPGDDPKRSAGTLDADPGDAPTFTVDAPGYVFENGDRFACS